MTPEDLKNRFDKIANRLLLARMELDELYSTLTRQDDRKALRDIIKNLTWASENCSVIGSHQIGQALDDNMGTGLKS